MTSPRIDRALTGLYGSPSPKAQLVKLKGDASTRSYYRAHIEGTHSDPPTSLIVMQLPDDLFASDEGGGLADTKRLPFLEVAKLLGDRGLPVPEIFAVDLENGIVLLEDLGDLTLWDALSKSPSERWPEHYERAIELLADLHERCGDLPAASIVRRRRFDRELLDWELEHFREWGLQALFGPLTGASRAALADAFSRIVHEIEAMPYGFVHRDYQSKNLMVRPDGALALIDFQDALYGPRTYDLVALLCDSYVALDLELQETMITRYAALRRIDPEALHREFWWVSLHRKLKDAGRFVFIDRVRRNPDFLRWYPQSLVYVGRAAQRVSGMEPLGAALESAIPGFPNAVSVPASSVVE